MKTLAKEQWKDRVVGFERRPAKDFQANSLNFRRHPNNQRDAFRGIVAELGFAGAVLENTRTGNLIDGHLRIEEALSIDQNMLIPCVQVDLSESEEKLLLASYDPISAMATADRETLELLLKDVSSSDEAVNAMLAKLAEDTGLSYGVKEEDESKVGELIDKAAELQQKWQVATGQIYQIGRHRLLCGDSTDAGDVSRLMDGAKAQLMVTDPPYGVDYGALVSSRKNQKKGGWDDIHNDALTTEQLEVLLTGALRGEGAVVAFVFHPAGEKRFAFWHALEANGWRIAQEIVWVKNALVFGRADYQWRHEPCLYAKKEGARKQDDRTQTTVWEVNKPTDSEHPTQKPIELFARPIRNHTDRDEIVREPFCGSGTAMVAAESVGRICYASELEPKYCAVTLERMSNLGLEGRLTS